MPQLSLYMDEASMAELRKSAEEAHKSISQYAREKLMEKPVSKWPDSFWATYGSIDDPTFVVPEDEIPDPEDYPHFD